MEAALEGIVAGPESVDRACYIDPAIFALEKSRIFERTWLFVAHASELADVGDYRTTELAGQPVIAIRGDDGQIRVFFNSCRHKGTIVVADKSGRCERLRCPYHHWTYNSKGELVNVPRVEGQGPAFKLEDNGLVPVPRTENFNDFIFANLDPGAESLEVFLGTAGPYLAEVARDSGNEMVAIGAYRYTYPANWKLLMENTLDDYHAEYLHGDAFSQRAEIFSMTGTSGIQEVAGTRWSLDLGIHGVYEQDDDERTLTIQKTRPHRVYVGVFPSLLALYHPLWDVTGLRIIEPVSVEETSVLTYCLAPKAAGAERRRAIGERFHYSWGPGGRAGVDDISTYSLIQRGMHAKGVGRVLTSRGMHRPDPLRGLAADENAIRGFWNGWRRYMLEQA